MKRTMVFALAAMMSLAVLAPLAASADEGRWSCDARQPVYQARIEHRDNDHARDGRTFQAFNDKRDHGRDQRARFEQGGHDRRR